MRRKIIIGMVAAAASVAVSTPAQAAAPSYPKHYKSRKNGGRVWVAATAYMGQPYRDRISRECRRDLNVRVTVKGDRYRRFAYTSKVSVNVTHSFMRRFTVTLDGQKRPSVVLKKLADTDCSAFAARFVVEQSPVKLSTPTRKRV